MTNNDPYQPKPEHKFSFGLWTVGNRGRDPSGDLVNHHFAECGPFFLLRAKKEEVIQTQKENWG
jgi:hypothetical protein